MRTRVLFTALFTLILLSCGAGSGGNNPPNSKPASYAYDFAGGAQSWVAGSADYPVSREPQIGAQTGIRALPLPLDVNRTGYYLAGDNNSDDLFLYLKRQITGLKPNTRYSLSFTVAFATRTNALNSMVMKAGATTLEPDRVVVTSPPPGYGTEPYYLMNIDKGNQVQGGKDAVVIGDTIKSHPNDLNWEWKTISSPNAFTVATDQNGSVWVLLGAECTFEVLNEIYYTTVRVDVQET